MGQLVEARTGAAADAALAGLGGGLASTVSSVRAAVIQVRFCRAFVSHVARGECGFVACGRRNCHSILTSTTCPQSDFGSGLRPRRLWQRWKRGWILTRTCPSWMAQRSPHALLPWPPPSRCLPVG